MISLLGKVPRHVTVACSGGVDSVVLLDFLSNNHRVDVAFFHHGTETSEIALGFIEAECNRRMLKLHVGSISDATCPSGYSKEEYWREERYKFLEKFDTVATAHHLDDVVETWVWSSLHGQSKLLPYRRSNVIRPLLLNRKYELEQWASKKRLNYVFDKSNNDVQYMRNYIRHNMMDHVLKVNPGIHTLLRKKLIDRGVDK